GLLVGLLRCGHCGRRLKVLHHARRDTRYICNAEIMLKASGKLGVPQGGVISCVLSNLYLNEVDRMLERAKENTGRGKYTFIEYVRFADDLVILIDAHPQHDWLMKAVETRLREELAKLHVQIN